ncbi:MAG: DUF3971 domain-containing protein [Aestuariivita sp.]|nr:DUF3971 domain-containing protein [Aestuariivita sp.]MCY4288451.1 DUF3971 domain-containing protein [Aestuariivita sp.]MCY4347618.1 DUF3971 domain-containing protein [Aestuariivita sp.]
MAEPRNKKHPMYRRLGSVTAKVLKYAAITLFVMFVLGFIIAYYASQSGHRVDLPKPIREQIEQLVSNSIGTAEMRFAQGKIGLTPAWDLTISLTGLKVSNDFRSDLSLEELSAEVAFLPLFASFVQPSKVNLRGLRVEITQTRPRDRSSLFDLTDPEFELRLNAGAQQWLALDRLLAIKELSSLQEISLQDAKIHYRSDDFRQEWEISSGTVEVIRFESNSKVAAELDVASPMGHAATIAVDITSATNDNASEFVISVTDIATSDLANIDRQLAWLSQFDTLLSVVTRGQINAAGEISTVNSKLMLGSGQFRFSNSDRPIEIRQAEVILDFNPTENSVHISRMTIASSLIMAELAGDLFLEDTRGTDKLSLLGQLHLKQAEIKSLEISQEPVTLKEGIADIRMTFDPLRVELGQLTVMLGETTFAIAGQVIDSKEGLNIALDATVDAITVGNLKKIWPRRAVVNVRDWVNRNLSHGQLEASNVAFRKIGERPPQVHFYFNYSDAEIRFMESMPPLRRASGQASFFNNRFSVTANTGYVDTDNGDVIDVGGTSFVVLDASMGKDTRAQVELEGKGSLTSVLTLLNQKPLEVLKGTNLLPTSVSGTGSFEGLIKLPLQQQINLSDLSFDVHASVTDVSSDSLIAGQLFESRQLSFIANEHQVKVSGEASISDIPISGEWTKPIGKPEAGSAVKARIALNETSLRAAGINTEISPIVGEAQADIQVVLMPNRSPRLTVKSDLVGLSIDAPAVKWSKTKEAEAELTLEVMLEQPLIRGDIAFEAPNLTLAGTFQSAGNDADLGVNLEKLQIGDWLDAALAVESLEPVRIRLHSGQLNLKEAPVDPSSAGKPNAAGVEIIVDGLNELQITPRISLTNVQGQINTGGGVRGTLTGRVNGQTPVNSEIVTRNEQAIIIVTSKDAGASLRDANLLSKVHRGELRLEIRTTDRPQEVDGTILMRNTFVRDVPAIAVLLNSMSLVGLLSELTGQGIYFGRVESEFRIDSEKIIFINGRATGPSLGFTMNGAVSQVKNFMDVEGVISPFYMINQVGGLLSPRQGEGLFGFNYRLTGDPNSPQVSVNLLSGLAPGFLRELFRVGGPSAQPEAEN